MFWVGEAMETFLVKPLQALAGDAKVVELWEVPGLTLLPTREGGMWEAHEHGGEHARADADHGAAEHAAGAWRRRRTRAGPSMRRATTMRTARPTCTSGSIPATPRCSWPRSRPRSATPTRAMLRSTRPMPSVCASSWTNSTALSRDRLAAVTDRPYVVFHDAYQYFEHRYGVNAVGAITINPTVRPSARRLGEIQRAARAARRGVRVRRAAVRADPGGHRDRRHERADRACSTRSARPSTPGPISTFS